ncbi:MAG: hypothetical protein ACI9RO_000613 [Alteromonas macleodii]|jgi:hypothetical protein
MCVVYLASHDYLNINVKYIRVRFPWATDFNQNRSLNLIRVSMKANLLCIFVIIKYDFHTADLIKLT